MTHRIPPVDPESPVILIEIGNSSTEVATWEKRQVKTPLSVPTDDHAAFGNAFAAHVDATPKHSPAAVIIGSVVPSALGRIRAYVKERLERDPLVIGERIPLPIDVSVKDAEAIGVDRVCAAAAAYDQLQTACTIVDFGTAVTVDLVDDEGTLVGGAILPGLRLQLSALHQHTAALPLVEPEFPPRPYGRDTTEAMQAGVCRGMVGAVRAVVEGYAALLNRWPQLVATGGDLQLIAPHCDFLDTKVQHLVLRGIGLAYANHLAAMGV